MVEYQFIFKDWEWRVKRYPWRISYGAKLVDRTASRMARLVKLPAPRHHDLESAKSMLIFCIKVGVITVIISKEGWDIGLAITQVPKVLL